ncbi:MAG: NAD-dependent epimerase/dehydratase family protein [Lactobacillus sp.]|jgi:dihydroflavonol-4-reductase|nr:NAD-dependent epimerase/dehydratase family protein [Lactobacillus sp.]MCI2032505.1 NAD-dependent epimerase/dehydratase family protein [Lactobacillus sp.]
MQTIVVTGGSGYVAEWVISDLLNHDYQVRASLRSLKKAARVQAAVAHQVPATKMARLTFFCADLTQTKGWAEAMVGADAVFHIASPLGNGTEAVDELVRIAKGGTVNVLAGAKAAGITRVVMISSQAAATAPKAIGAVELDDDYWTDMRNPELVPYYVSKVEAEKAAWAFANAHGLALTTLLPGGIFGPLLDAQVQSSNALVSELLKMPLVPPVHIEVTDVRDLALAMRLALEAPAAVGQRYNVGTRPTTFPAIIAAYQQAGLRTKKMALTVPSPLIKLAAKVQPALRQLLPQLGINYWHSSRHIKHDLQWQPRAWQETMRDSALSLRDWQLID